LPPGLSGTAGKIGQRLVLSDRCCSRAGRLSPVPALPSRERTGQSGLGRHGHHGRARPAPDRSGFLDHRSVDALAAALGIGPRHLLRLLLRHAGATPSEVAATLRVQRAKRLLDETSLRLSEIAFAAGFGSIRRFNTAFRSTYGRAPSSFRSSAR
jgi:AraC-like DNA-binding protein